MNAMRRIDRFTTPLSERGALRRRISVLFHGLARLSLVLAGSGMTAGCIIEDPPPYTPPEQTPPRLDLRRAVPLVDQVIVASRGDRIAFNVPVFSEDKGDDLIARLLLNYQGEGAYEQSIDSDKVSASTLEDATREIDMEWQIPQLPPGCKRLTLLVSHLGNLDPLIYPEVIDKSDQALAVWWVNIEPTPGNEDMLTDCPLATAGEN
jgi:hypothetical protein